MFCNHSSINSKQVGNFLLRKPDGFVLQINFYFHFAIGRGIKQDFVSS